MKLNFRRSEFLFKDEAGNEILAIYTPCERPAHASKGQFYSIQIFKNGQEIGGFISSEFVNKTNAAANIGIALKNPIV
jgi:hypothetical protein